MKEKNIYESIDGQDYMLGGIGVTVNGVIETDKEVESPLFRRVENKPVETAPPPVPVATAAPVTPPVNDIQTSSVAQPTPVADTPPAPQVNEQKEQI